MNIPINKTGTYKVRSVYNPSDRYSDFSNTVTILSLSKDIIRLEDLLPEPEKFGIFEFMRQEQTEMGTFLNSILGTAGLGIENLMPIDMEYIYNKSGKKSVSQIVKTFVHRWNVTNFEQYPITVGNFTDISAIIRARYLQKWKKLWETIQLDYDVLNPFDVHFTDNVTTDHTHTEDIREYEDNDDGKNYTYGFNDSSESGSPLGRNTDNSKGNSKLQHTRDATYDRETTRRGNIGNITRQQLIEQQRNLLQFQFFDVVFNDVDKILTMPIYD